MYKNAQKLVYWNLFPHKWWKIFINIHRLPYNNYEGEIHKRQSLYCTVLYWDTQHTTCIEQKISLFILLNAILVVSCMYAKTGVNNFHEWISFIFQFFQNGKCTTIAFVSVLHDSLPVFRTRERKQFPFVYKYSRVYIHRHLIYEYAAKEKQGKCKSLTTPGVM